MGDETPTWNDESYLDEIGASSGTRSVQRHLQLRRTGLLRSHRARLHLLTPNLYSELQQLPVGTEEGKPGPWVLLTSSDMITPDGLYRRNRIEEARRRAIRGEPGEGANGDGDDDDDDDELVYGYRLAPPPLVDMGDPLIELSPAPESSEPRRGVDASEPRSPEWPPDDDCYAEEIGHIPPKHSDDSDPDDEYDPDPNGPSIGRLLKRRSPKSNRPLPWKQTTTHARVLQVLLNGASKPKKIQFKRVTTLVYPNLPPTEVIQKWTMLLKEGDVLLDWIYLEAACKINRIWKDYGQASHPQNPAPIWLQPPARPVPNAGGLLNFLRSPVANPVRFPFTPSFQYCDERFAVPTEDDGVFFHWAIRGMPGRGYKRTNFPDSFVASDIYTVFPLSRIGGLIEFADHCKTATKIAYLRPLFVNAISYWFTPLLQGWGRCFFQILDFLGVTDVNTRSPDSRARLSRWLFSPASSDIKASNMVLLSSVAAFVTSYLMDVNDMHQDNILYSGEILLVDFGFLGDAPIVPTFPFPLPYSLRLCLRSEPYMWEAFKELSYRALQILQVDLGIGPLSNASLFHRAEKMEYIRQQLRVRNMEHRRFMQRWRREMRSTRVLAMTDTEFRDWFNKMRDERNTLENEYAQLDETRVSLSTHLQHLFASADPYANLFTSTMQNVHSRGLTSREELDVMIEWGSYRSIPKLCSRFAAASVSQAIDWCSSHPWLWRSLVSSAASLAGLTLHQQWFTPVLRWIGPDRVFSTLQALRKWAPRSMVGIIGAYAIGFGLSYVEQLWARHVSARIAKSIAPHRPVHPSDRWSWVYGASTHWVDWIRRACPLGVAWTYGLTNPLKWSFLSQLCLFTFAYQVILGDCLMIKKREELRIRYQILQIQAAGQIIQPAPLPAESRLTRILTNSRLVVFFVPFVIGYRKWDEIKTGLSVGWSIACKIWGTHLP